MALTAYINATQRLLQLPPAPTTLYATSDITSYINSARGQLAGESESIRVGPLGATPATLAVTSGVQVYPFSAINLNGAPGVAGVFNVRQSMYAVGTGQKWMRPRPFEWFTLYKLNNPVAGQAANMGPPFEWSQYGQGSTGSLYISPVPDTNYTLLLDTVCLPIALAQDSDPEAIPYPWTDAIPFFAAWYALLAAQTAARQADADRMMKRYMEFKDRARTISNATVLPFIYPQSGDPTTQNLLGLQPTKSAGGG